MIAAVLRHKLARANGSVAAITSHLWNLLEDHL
jgi:hypothetical protein